MNQSQIGWLIVVLPTSTNMLDFSFSFLQEKKSTLKAGIHKSACHLHKKSASVEKTHGLGEEELTQGQTPLDRLAG